MGLVRWLCHQGLFCYPDANDNQRTSVDWTHTSKLWEADQIKYVSIYILQAHGIK